jgi:hypothetical protein
MQFGIYLVRHGMITADQFVDALDRQLHGRVPIGELAIKRGYLTMHQVFDVLDRQAEDGRLFGQIAVDSGYLTESALNDLLHVQAEYVPSLRNVLAEMRILTDDVIQRQWRAYSDTLHVRSEIAVQVETETSLADAPELAEPDRSSVGRTLVRRDYEPCRVRSLPH